jgi:preprotein translocase subunit SecB
MYSVISKTTVLFLREVRALGIFGLSVAPRHHTKKCAIFSCANIFHVRIFFATSMLPSRTTRAAETSHIYE